MDRPLLRSRDLPSVPGFQQIDRLLRRGRNLPRRCQQEHQTELHWTSHFMFRASRMFEASGLSYRKGRLLALVSNRPHIGGIGGVCK